MVAERDSGTVVVFPRLLRGNATIVFRRHPSMLRSLPQSATDSRDDMGRRVVEAARNYWSRARNRGRRRGNRAQFRRRAVPQNVQL